MAAPNLRRLTPRAHLALALVGTFLSACAGEGDVDRVQPDAIDKTIFLKEDGSPRLFYYRETMTGMPPTSICQHGSSRLIRGQGRQAAGSQGHSHGAQWQQGQSSHGGSGEMPASTAGGGP